MEVQGYATIKKDATTGAGLELETFLGQDVRVMEFAQDGGVLCLNSAATAMAMFEKEDVKRSFRCSVEGNVICPPSLNILERFAYQTKVMSRKGGYNNTLKAMVIQASLMKGKFYDYFLWAKQ